MLALYQPGQLPAMLIWQISLGLLLRDAPGGTRIKADSGTAMGKSQVLNQREWFWKPLPLVAFVLIRRFPWTTEVQLGQTSHLLMGLNSVLSYLLVVSKHLGKDGEKILILLQKCLNLLYLIIQTKDCHPHTSVNRAII